MTVTDIPYEFLIQRAELGWNEIKFGLDLHLIMPKTAIEHATQQLCGSGCAPKEAVELASLTEEDSVADLILRLANDEPVPTGEHMKAKWLYLVLAWLFENRGSLADALGMVESVYSDFDYPKEMASFVRYMPMDGPDLGDREQNEKRMLDHWKTYLDISRQRFGRESKSEVRGGPHD